MLLQKFNPLLGGIIFELGLLFMKHLSVGLRTLTKINAFTSALF